MNRNQKVKVTNRSNGTVILRVPDRHFRAELNPKETREITYGDIIDIAARPGGRALIYNYLLVQDPKALREGLNISEEPEYWLKEDAIPNWLNLCPLDEFHDALEFAPQGILDLIKKYSVSIPLNDYSKRKAVLDILDFDVTAAIANEEASKVEAAEATAPSKNRKAKTVSYDVPGSEVEEVKETKPKRTAKTTAAKDETK